MKIEKIQKVSNFLDKVYSVIFKTLPIILIVTIGCSISYMNGLDNGKRKGYSIAIDSVYQILELQLKQDTSVTRLILIDCDTNTYILSPKELLE